jgi:hypothetical protein
MLPAVTLYTTAGTAAVAAITSAAENNICIPLTIRQG